MIQLGQLNQNELDKNKISYIAIITLFNLSWAKTFRQLSNRDEVDISFCSKCSKVGGMIVK